VSLAPTDAAAYDALPVKRPVDWEQSFGKHWKIDLAIIAAVVFLFGAVRPLADPDLPLHLAVGEWILHHHALPLTEPFSWTRPGAPYYAYSWLPQTTFYLVLDHVGHVGLRALQGLLLVATAASAVVFARAAGWRPSQAIILAGFNLIVAAFFVALLRPQSILLVTVPLTWAGFVSIVRARPLAPALTMLFAASALTANSHLFFPLTLAPAALLLVPRGVPRRTGVLAVLAVLAGWMATPYALNWVQVFQHNFGRNYLYRPPSAITELQPGFVGILYPAPSPMLLLVAAMLSVPWLLQRASLTRREQWLCALYWSAGTILFGYATRLFIVWWLLAIMPVGLTIAYVTRNTEDAPPRLRFRIFGLLACLFIVGTEAARLRPLWAREGNSTRRTLPTFGALAVDPLASWLETHVAPGARPRVLTAFAFGSYVTWRLPGYSASIDSRGVFPDSVSAAEAIVGASDRDVPLGPWRSSDIALLPVRYRVAAVLDTATGWRRALTVPGNPVGVDSAALWIRVDWLTKHSQNASHRRARPLSTPTM
jgi:hypothetical protein